VSDHQRIASNLETLGEAQVDLLGIPSLPVRFSYTADYKREERRVYLTGFKILNDIGGLANKLIESTSIGVGRSLRVPNADDELLVSLLPEASPQESQPIMLTRVTRSCPRCPLLYLSSHALLTALTGSAPLSLQPPAKGHDQSELNLKSGACPRERVHRFN
jgi:hypothetical protein